MLSNKYLYPQQRTGDKIKVEGTEPWLEDFVYPQGWSLTTHDRTNVVFKV
jgi:hypothetical protein